MEKINIILTSNSIFITIKYGKKRKRVYKKNTDNHSRISSYIIYAMMKTTGQSKQRRHN